MIENNARMDVAVIGSGVTGMIAAITAAEGGLKVVLFENNVPWEGRQISFLECLLWKPRGNV